mmetsp:Transcript_421/g.1008  ORF Transcript_421/g.1008 Transcript_421/m.1008 type:complete len:339 (-) Transcript_421:6515-7531(-)
MNITDGDHTADFNNSESALLALHSGTRSDVNCTHSALRDRRQGIELIRNSVAFRTEVNALSGVRTILKSKESTINVTTFNIGAHILHGSVATLHHSRGLDGSSCSATTRVAHHQISDVTQHRVTAEVNGEDVVAGINTGQSGHRNITRGHSSEGGERVLHFLGSGHGASSRSRKTVSLVSETGMCQLKSEVTAIRSRISASNRNNLHFHSSLQQLVVISTQAELLHRQQAVGGGVNHREKGTIRSDTHQAVEGCSVNRLQAVDILGIVKACATHTEHVSRRHELADVRRALVNVATHSLSGVVLHNQHVGISGGFHVQAGNSFHQARFAISGHLSDGL